MILNLVAIRNLTPTPRATLGIGRIVGIIGRGRPVFAAMLCQCSANRPTRNPLTCYPLGSYDIGGH
jgi:hypothetical protein